ncbi:Zn(II)2Cys6 transcription factor [Aspergillus foveolatus]|uniref:Zn(II)2Cys6 transcription factor n=1 Tax=Aspergillus foveolatus TaxID=210207 RepID=UPI003CCD0BF1
MSHRGKYTPRACEECRRRRAKCDGKKPACSRCVHWQISCQYSTAEDGRRPASKAYVLSLRQKIDSLERLLERHGIDPRKDNEGGQAIDELTESFEGKLAFEESLNFEKDGELRYFGPTSGRLQFQSSSALHTEETVPSIAYCDRADAVTAEIGIPEHIQDHLIGLYFTWEHPWFSVVDERLFREDMSSGGRYWSPLLHFSILALGSRFTDRVDVRLDPSDPNTAGKLFLEHAKNFLGKEMETPSLTTIQALVILGMFYIATGADAAGWLHHGMANRLCLDMGLNLDPAGFQEMNILSHREIQLRRQIYWSLYFHDKLSSNYTGRICSMLTSQGAVKAPEDDEVMDTNSPAQKEFKQLRRAIIGISQIQERIILSLWAPKPLLKEHQRSSFLHSCLLDLRSWFYDLPTELRINRPTPNTYPQAYTLHMVYHTTRILLAKPYITRKQPETDREAVNIASTASRESARAICLTAQKYRHVFGGFQKSPITATHCTLSAALVLLAEVEVEAKTSLVSPAIASLKNKLNFCLTVLDELSNSWSPAKYIARNLRKLCLSATSDEMFSTATQLNPADKSDFDATIPLDTSAELSYNFFELHEHGVPQLSPINSLPSHLELSMPVDSLPVDYGFFDILNDATWDQMW